MQFKIKHLNAKEASKLSVLLKNYSCEALLKAGQYCIDGKSVLGILSIMESEPDDIILEINELPDELQAELGAAMSHFLAN